MKSLGLFVVAMALATMAISQTASPELVSSGGGSFNNTSYRLDWSIGECVTLTHGAETYMLTQGFHQSSYEITAIGSLPDARVDISVYPNPTTNFITLNLSGQKSFGDLSALIITDINGKVLLQEKINGFEKQLDFSSYPAGVYFLTLKQGGQLIKSFKIIKK